MNRGSVILALAALVLAAGVWLALPRDRGVPRPLASPPGQDFPGREGASRKKLSALPNGMASRLRAVREAIANTPEGTTLDYEFAELLARVAKSLTTDELIAGLTLLDEVGFTIETICLDEECPLDRQIAILDRFGHSEDQGISDAMVATAHAYAQIDPAATRAWLRQFEPGPGPGQGLDAVFRRLDETDRAASIEMLCDLDDHDDHEAENIIGYAEGPDLKHLSGREFLALVVTFSSDKLREFNLRRTVVWHLAADDPEDALKYVRELPPDERHASHGRQLVQGWTRREGRQFEEIIGRIENDLPVEVRSPENYYVLAEAWFNQSPAAVRDWIGTLAGGACRDAAIAGYARDSTGQEGAATFALALTMTDPAKRQKTVGWAMRRWADDDPDAVRAALPDADISDNDRQMIERALKE